MSYNDAMALLEYIQTHPPANRPQFLDIHTQNRRYTFCLQTAHLDEHRIGTGHKPGVHAHHVFHLILFNEGVNRFQMEHALVPSEPGTLVLCDPDTPHDFGPIDPGQTCYHEITFTLDHRSGPLMVSFRQLLEFYAGLPLVDIPSAIHLTPKRRKHLEKIFRELTEGLCGPQAVNWFRTYRHLFEIFSFLITELFTPAGETHPIDRGPLARVKMHLDHYYATALTIGELARLAHCSEAHLCRTFKKEYGLSPIAYQQSLRIGAAKNLIRSTHLRFKEIADRLGYADVYCFSKAFRKLTGHSPTQWRSSPKGSTAEH